MGNGPLSRAEKEDGKRIRLRVIRPQTRGDCANGPRPCGFVSCRYNLYLDVNPRTGSLKLNFPGVELDELAETCALDVADRGGVTLDEAGMLIGVTMERSRQIQLDGMHDAEVELRLLWGRGWRKNLEGLVAPIGIDLPDAP
jgi:hypothetical protein